MQVCCVWVDNNHCPWLQRSCACNVVISIWRIVNSIRSISSDHLQINCVIIGRRIAPRLERIDLLSLSISFRLFLGGRRQPRQQVAKIFWVNVFWFIKYLFRDHQSYQPQQQPQCPLRPLDDWSLRLILATILSSLNSFILCQKIIIKAIRGECLEIAGEAVWCWFVS